MSPGRDNLKRCTTLPGACTVATKSTNGTWLCSAKKSKERTDPLLMIFMPINRPSWLKGFVSCSDINKLAV